MTDGKTPVRLLEVEMERADRSMGESLLHHDQELHG